MTTRMMVFFGSLNLIKDLKDIILKKFLSLILLLDLI